jgi:predicted DNA-binding transcriptional regulator AlpA
MTPILLRFSDLKARRIVATWPTLRHWIEREGFPPGRKLGPNARAWTEQEINEWLAGRPTAGRAGTTLSRNDL